MGGKVDAFGIGEVIGKPLLCPRRYADSII